MAKESVIRKIRCPHCTWELAVSEESGEETCPFCGQSVSYDFSSQQEESKNVQFVDNSTGILIGNGNKDPRSVIIFLQDYLEKHKDTVGKIYNTFGVEELQKVVDEIKLSHGGEKETWELDFESVCAPAELRVKTISETEEEMCKLILEGGSREEVYTKFDVIVEAMKAFNDLKERIEFELERALGRYKEYGGDSKVLRELTDRKSELLKKLKSFEEIPESLADLDAVKKALKESDDRIAKDLMGKGIDAPKLYEEAIKLEGEGELAQAAYKYSLLSDYKDAYERFTKLNRYVIFDNLFDVGNNPHILREHVSDVSLAKTKRQAKKALKKEKKEQETDEKARSHNGSDLLKIKDGEPTDEVAVKDFKQHLTTFGNLFYYISRKGTIHTYNLKTGVDSELESTAKHHEKELCELYDNGRHILLLSEARELLTDEKKIKKDAKKRARKKDFEPQEANRYRVDILNLGSDINFFEPLVEKVAEVEKFPSGYALSGNFMSFIRNTYDKRKTRRCIFAKKQLFETHHRMLVNVKTKQVYDDIIDYNDHYVALNDKEIYFTRFSPTCYNLKLMKKDLASLEETELLDNIFDVKEVKGDKVFYTVGNTKKQSLFVLDMPSGERKQVFERFVGYLKHEDGYFYVYRGAGLNKTLFKISEDGEHYYILGRNMGEGNYTHFSMNGYFYYENYLGNLLRVRLDGSNETLIAKNLEKVIKIDNKFVYYSCHETVDRLSGGSEDKYLQGISIYRYNSETKSSEKVIFNLAKWQYEPKKDLLYAVRRSEETYRSTSLKERKNFNYNTVVEKYVTIDFSNNLEEKDILTYGLPHGDRKGCFLFRMFNKKKDRSIKFERLPWERPYIYKKERKYSK